MNGMDDKLSDHQKETLRNALIDTSCKLLNIKYEYGAEWNDYSILPVSLDCSELVKGCYRINGLKMPDGAQNQFDFTVPLPMDHLQPGDLVFFGKAGDFNKIYHVGMVFDKEHVIEARGYQPESSFDTGKVILRPVQKWFDYKNFAGVRSHPRLT